jgi:tripartite-type tricarboxylate transporter receptor subunit TctC
MRRSVFVVLAALGLWAVSDCIPAHAQDYPNRPITLVIPFAPGGSTSIVGRVVADKMGEILGQSVVVDNRAGAGGTIGTRAVSKSPPDGYTLLLGYTGTLAIGPTLYPNAGYDPRKDFAPIGLIGNAPNSLVVHPSFPAKSVKELIDYAKANPGKLTVGTPGAGSQAHLVMELLLKQTGTTMTYVPYRGGANIAADLMGGQIDLTVTYVPALLGAVKDGSLRGLFVTTLERSTQLPEVPTVNESGFPGFEAVAWYAVVAPAGTPRPIIDRLNVLINGYLKSPTGQSQLEALDMQPVGGTPEQLRSFIDGEVAKWGPIIKAAGIEM